MKKRFFLIIFTLALVIFTGNIFATSAGPRSNNYNFDIEYTGDVVAKEAKNATVILEGTDATPYTNVRIKVELVSGPATPTIIAYESNGTGYNILDIGYWGPDEGFAVGNTFRNETPVVATYPEAGTYVIRLSLINKQKDDEVITSKEFSTTVLEAPAIDNNVANNVVEEIPQTGISIWTYLVTIVIVIALIYGANKILRK